MSDGELADTATNFAAWLCEKRKAANFRSATAAAKRAGVTSATWASWERGAFLPHPTRYPPAIGRVLKVDPRDVQRAAGYDPDAYPLEVTGDSAAELAELIEQLPERERLILSDLVKSWARLAREASQRDADEHQTIRTVETDQPRIVEEASTDDPLIIEEDDEHD